jgi:hypothetical protein
MRLAVEVGAILQEVEVQDSAAVGVRWHVQVFQVFQEAPVLMAGQAEIAEVQLVQQTSVAEAAPLLVLVYTAVAVLRVLQAQQQTLQLIRWSTAIAYLLHISAMVL